VTNFERMHLPRGLAIGLVVTGFLSASLAVIAGIKAVIPTEQRLIELKVHALYAVNERYTILTGLDHSTNGNRLYRLVHTDIDAMMDELHEVLGLTPEEQVQFLASRAQAAGVEPGSDALLGEHEANVTTATKRARRPLSGGGMPRHAEPHADQRAALIRTPLTALGEALSSWIIAPFVFFFLLHDTGEIKRGFLRLVPNRLFEPALAILFDLDRAVGNYLRGLSLSCALLGITIMSSLFIIGVPFRWSFAIGLLAGLTNVVPYLGSVLALLAGLAYAFFGEEFHPLLPLVQRDSLALWVVGAVLLSDLIKNAVYDPVVLGGAVRLHPLVVIIGFVSGTLMFGMVGAILAIPAITILTVFVSSTTKHLKAYGLI
jgi:predicted PurR-regulated permease PerM